MNKMFTVYVGVLLLAVHVSQAMNGTTTQMTPTMSNYTVMTTLSSNYTGNVTSTKGASASVRSDAFTLLPVALAACLLHGRF